MILQFRSVIFRALLLLLLSVNYSAQACTPRLALNCPNTSGDPQSFVAGCTAQVNGATDSVCGPSPNSSRWDWGDGSTPSASFFPGRHVYRNSGQYVLTVKADDHIQQCQISITDCAQPVIPNQTKLVTRIEGEAAEDGSGFSVALSARGDRVAIGAPWNDGNGESSGHVRVYTSSGSSWLKLGNDIDGEAQGDRSGVSVALSGDGSRVAIGASRNTGNGEASGHARVFEWAEDKWLQLGHDIDGEAAGDYSGTAVAISSAGDRLAVGASGNDDNGESSGHVKVYSWSGADWLQLGSSIVGEAAGDHSGSSVALSGNGKRLAVGATDNDGLAVNSGHARVYEWSGTAWHQLGMDIDGTDAEDSSGYAVSLSADGGRLAIGAPYNDDNGETSGQVRVYEWSGTRWRQLGNNIGGEAEHDRSGWSVSLSPSGERLAVGARTNDGNGEFSGQVRMYSWSGSAWLQLGADMDGGAAEDLFGYSVSLSTHGNWLAAGAIVPNYFPGYVRIYEVPISATQEDAKSIARLYSAAFDRVPGIDGLNFWINSFEEGQSLSDIAKKFIESPEFNDKYGPLTNREYIEQLFRNVLGREGYPSGIDFWLKHMERGTSKAIILAKFSDSPENKSKTAVIFANMRFEGGRWVF